MSKREWNFFMLILHLKNHRKIRCFKNFKILNNSLHILVICKLTIVHLFVIEIYFWFHLYVLNYMNFWMYFIPIYFVNIFGSRSFNHISATWEQMNKVIFCENGLLFASCDLKFIFASCDLKLTRKCSFISPLLPRLFVFLEFQPLWPLFLEKQAESFFSPLATL